MSANRCPLRVGGMNGFTVPLRCVEYVVVTVRIFGAYAILLARPNRIRGDSSCETRS